MRRLLALALYVFIGLPAILGTLFLVPARSWILDRDFYKHIVSGPEARAVLETPALYERFEGTLEAGDRLRLSGPAAGKALQKSLPVPEILSAADTAVDSAFDSLEAPSGAGRLRMDMRPLKSALGRGAPDFARVYAEEVPVSRDASAALLASAYSSGAALDLSVRPADASEADFRRVVGGVLDAAVSEIPETLEGGPPDVPGSLPFPGGVRTPRDALNRAALWLALLAGGVWIAGGVISSDSAAKRLKWLGSTLILPGVVVLASGALIRKPFLTISAGFLVSGSAALVLGGGLSASRKALKYRDFE